MLSRAALLAVTMGAMSVAAAPGLSLKVSGADVADGIENLKVTATLTNTGDEEIKLLNDPRTALSKIPTDSFKISSASGKKPDFAGIKVKYSPEKVIQRNKEETFTVLAPGKSIDVEHELGSAYNFTTAGADNYNIEANNLFRYVDSDNKVQTIRAKSASSFKTSLSGKLALGRRDSGFAKRSDNVLSKRIEYQSCDDGQQSTLSTAADNANDFASESLSYLQGISDGTDRYTEWFGTFSEDRYNTVVDQYTAISENDFQTYTYDCSCTDSGTYAYVYPDEFGTIYLCGVFWDTEDTGTDSRAGTLIHESSHFTKLAGTDDIVYGQSGARDLADSDPDQAIMNADSHEYFSENTPALD